MPCGSTAAGSLLPRPARLLSGATTINNGGILDFQYNAGGSTVSNPITLNSGGGINSRSANAFTLSGATLPASGTIGFNNDDGATYAFTVSNGACALGRAQHIGRRRQ